MTEAIRHRGPDDDGYYSDDGVAIGVRRLSIVDVAGGHQPMADSRGTIVAAQNGELYNHRKLRTQLEGAGHAFRTTCDTEILPALYRTYGDAAPEHLNGIYAFVIWDAERRRAVLARDRLGVKPLYYSDLGSLLVFASELKALLASGLVPLEIDAEAVDLYLSLGFTPGPRTLLRHVQKLMPGHRLVVEPPAVRVERYWQYPESQPTLGRSDDEWRDEFLELLEDAVVGQLMSDVPLGAMLSGGLDSSVIAVLMARHATGPVKTFSVGFAGAAESELAGARATAAAIGAAHHELELSFDDELDLESLVRSLDEPLADLSAAGFSALSALTAKHVTVALSGQGADELLAGYDRYRQVALLERTAVLPGFARRAGAYALRRGPERLRRGATVAAAVDPVAAAIAARSEWSEAGRRRAARGTLLSVRSSLLEEVIADRIGASAARGVERALHLDGQLNLVDDMLHYFDRTSMAHSLEVRVPYLDHRLVELCATMPTNLKLRNRTTKWILREAAKGLVPDHVLDTPKVGFFSGAITQWFDRQVGGVVGEVLLDPGARYAEFVDRNEVARLMEKRGSHRTSKLLLAVLMLELWLRQYVAAPTARPIRAGAAR